MVALLVVLALDVTPAVPPKVFLVPGTFHADEVKVADGASLLALCGEELKAVRVKVSAVKDELADQGDARTGKEVAAPCPAIALFSGVAGLRAGRVAQATAVDEPMADGGTKHPRDRWAFRGEGPKVPALTLAYERVGELGYRVTAAAQGAPRVLVEFPTADFPPDARPQVVWVGDLNRDGRLDLLLGASNHYNVGQTRLFLSSGKDGALVEVASFTSAGC